MTRHVIASHCLLVALSAVPHVAAAQHVHPPQQPAAPTQSESGSAAPKQGGGGQSQPKEPIPPISDADRKAAFPADMEGHTVHDRKFNYYVLFDQLEWQGAGDGGVTLENTSWFGGDTNRLWLRFDAESDDGDLDHASADVLWGHSFTRWWDVVAGVRQDIRPGDPLTWAAVGVQGLAPQWFEVELTGYLGEGGRTAATAAFEYELLFTNRLMLQPTLEVELYGKDDLSRGIGAGLSSIETGLRLRYEIRRELAPYVGVSWDQKLFGTADIARDNGEDAGRVRFTFGVRTWF
jgi:copper resistance protein B